MLDEPTSYLDIRYKLELLDILKRMAKEKGITVEDVAEEITYRKETNAFSNNPKNEAFMNMTLNELVRIKEMWNI